MKSARKLNFSDVFKMARIFCEANIKEDIITFVFSGKEKRDEIIKRINEPTEREKALDEARTNMGIEFFFTILEKASNSEKKIYAFLANIAEIKVEEIEKSPLNEIAELIADIVKENEDFGSFFISALRSPTAGLSTKS